MKVSTAVFTASIDNEEEVRDWLGAVQRHVRQVTMLLDATVELLESHPHVKITLDGGSSADADGGVARAAAAEAEPDAGDAG